MIDLIIAITTGFISLLYFDDVKIMTVLFDEEITSPIY